MVITAAVKKAQAKNKTVKVEFKAAKGAQFTDQKAEKYGSYLWKLEKKGKHPLEPHAVVERARNPKTPIHEYFDWDDSTAGEKWRIQQARQLINHIVVVVEHQDNGGGSKTIRAFHNIQVSSEEDNKERGYVTLQTVISNPDMQEQIIKQALSEINSWKEKYALYQKLTPIFEAIKRVEETLS